MATREELSALAELRLREAEALFDAQLYDGCVYLCGYVVELALKATICRLLGIQDYPDKRSDRIGNAFRTHDFDELRLLAGLQNEGALNAGPVFDNWSTATTWKPEVRYAQVGHYNRETAERVLEAVRGQPHGVLTWLRQRW